MAGSFVMSTQAVPHLVLPPVHASAHALPEQTIPLAHGFVQPPQLAGSFVVSTQAVPHLVVPPAQLSAQAPPEHT